ncbi:hypothetical protein Tco_1104029 [Tanacetum coccineum]
MMLIFGLLEALEMEALVDVMDVDNAFWAKIAETRMKKRWNGVPCHDHFEVVEFGFKGQKGRLDIAQQCTLIVIVLKMRIRFHDVIVDKDELETCHTEDLRLE